MGRHLFSKCYKVPLDGNVERNRNGGNLLGVILHKSASGAKSVV